MSDGATEKIEEAVRRLVAVAAGMPGLPHMKLLNECFSFLINDCRIVSAHKAKRGIPVSYEEAKAFMAKLDDLQFRVGQHLEAYEAEHGVDLGK